MTPLLVTMTAAITLTTGSPDTLAAAHFPGGSVRPADPIPAPPVVKPVPVSTLAGDVLLLHATNKGTGIDPKLGKMPELSKPPFSSYNSYKLVDHLNPKLEKGKPSAIKLPTQRELRVVFKDVLAPQKANDIQRYVVSASIEKVDGKSFLPLLEVNAKAGEVFWLAGQDYDGGSLFIGIKVNP